MPEVNLRLTSQQPLRPSNYTSGTYTAQQNRERTIMALQTTVVLMQHHVVVAGVVTE